MNKSKVVFSIVGALLISGFLISINKIVNPSDHWSIYPSFVVIFWPIIVYHYATKKYNALSLVSALSLVTFLVIINYVTSSAHLWFLYATYPILLWPIIMYAGKWRNKISFTILSSASIIAYYIVLNVYLSPGYPWSIFTTFIFLWWPLIRYCVIKKRYMLFSLVGTFLISVFFILVNWISTPSTIWAIYPIFAAMWWPLVTYCFGYMKHKDDHITKKKGMIK
ncbi:hypothetical protein [Vallitalea okinawensis]|uniref:hypothetical protein n=1 Tax=Vallitalea okinawensis TaxID=2078660 RepID=UPI000CFE0F87|nr:hypothetical protein [Vallitalea okinawensis]